MRILGIDPGYATVGYGIIEHQSGKFSVINFGAVTTPAGMEFPKRLKSIYDDITYLIETHKPECIAIEKLYFNTNTTTAIDVAQARGVIVLAAQNAGIEVFEYTPLQVKQAVTGYGRAEKFQVMDMVKNLLKLKAVPKPDDTADALALAICHAHYSGSNYSKIYTEARK
ncbi:MAG: crossover junction endodeoxyribonuclease RuvC [Clostridia bacterium]|nr:crossover junction endodeoxyribonuclease RuvC [Clostridia bacterium]